VARPTLQKELRKKRPFDLAEEEAGLNLLRSGEFVREPFDRLFADYGISDPQYNVLRILRGHGGRGLPCTEIAAQMVSRMPDMTRLVDRLEKAGLVRRCRTANDRRVVLICNTAEGLALLARLDAPVRELHRKTLGHLTRRELAELNRLLVKARSSS
jgi:DNA-binding MarR family transcriptional regulator